MHCHTSVLSISFHHQIKSFRRGCHNVLLVEAGVSIVGRCQSLLTAYCHLASLIPSENIGDTQLENDHSSEAFYQIKDMFSDDKCSACIHGFVTHKIIVTQN